MCPHLKDTGGVFTTCYECHFWTENTGKKAIDAQTARDLCVKNDIRNKENVHIFL